MDVTVYSYPTSDPILIDKIVNEFLSQGKFDKLRKECMADADTKPAYQNLQQRVENTVSQFLKKQIWKPDLNKNQLRDSLRKHILESGFLDAGINRIVDQIVNPNVLATVFMPEVEEVVYNYLSIPRPGDKSHKHSGQKALKTEETNTTSEKIKREETSDIFCDNMHDSISSEESTVEMQIENGLKEDEIKREDEDTVAYPERTCAVKEESKLDGDEVSESNKLFPDKMELPSDDSQESLSRMGVERLRISESDGNLAPDSDASLPLEINEKSMSDSRDSDDSIMNKMSPISQGRLTPEEPMVVEEEKKPLTFIGRIPKIKRDDSESSKSSKKDEKGERVFGKSVYSSDESDSSKSIGKSDSDDKRTKEAKSKNEEPGDKSDRKYKESDEKRKKSDHHRSHSKERKSRCEKSSSSSSKDKEKERSHSRSDKGRDKDRKSSSHSRSKSSSHHKSVHREHHRDDSKSRDKDKSRHDRKDKDKRDIDKRKKEEEKKKKSKSTDDHGKERNKRDDRRSTDRDSNERERGKDTSSSRVQSDGRKKEKEQKMDDSQKEKSQKEESDEKEREAKDGKEEVMLPKEEEKPVLVPEEKAAVLNNGIVIPMEKEENAPEEKVVTPVESIRCVDVKALFDEGVLTTVQFPKVIDDFYVKFDSTGFRYFEEWETTKLDCEEEFKEFIDEAENDLSLLSDDGSDYESSEDHSRSEARRKSIVSNSLRGFGNFTENIIFDPVGYNFYRWRSRKEYEEYFGKKEEPPSPARKAVEKSTFGSSSAGSKLADEEETSEKNKENEDRKKRIRKSMKFLNRYQRKIGLKLKYGKEQHRFVRRRKKQFWNLNYKMREWNNGSSIECGGEVSNNPLVVLPPVLKECLDLENHSDSSGMITETSVDDTIYVNGRETEEGTENSERENTTSSSGLTAPKMDVEAKIRLYQIQAMRRNKTSSGPGKTCILARLSSGSKGELEDDREEENENRQEMALTHYNRKGKKRGIRIGLSRPKIPRMEEFDGNNQKNFNLPLSPESDDSSLNNTAKNFGVLGHKKNQKKGMEEEYSTSVPMIPGKKLKVRRMFNQKYESQDLYKPRPFSIGSKTRGRTLRHDGLKKSKTRVSKITS